jgi:hypothetical protein
VQLAASLDLVRTASVQKELHLRAPAIGQGCRIRWILGSRTFKSRSLNEIWRLVFSSSCNHRRSQPELMPLPFKDPVFLGAGPTTSILIRARLVVQVQCRSFAFTVLRCPRTATAPLQGKASTIRWEPEGLRCTNEPSIRARFTRFTAKMADHQALTMTSSRAASTTSARGSSGETCLDPCAAPGPTTPGRGGGAKILRITLLSSCLHIIRGTTFNFVTDGIHAALARARETSQGKDIRLGGGVATIREYLRDGLVDELHLAYAPVFLGSGEYLLAGMDLPALGYHVTSHITTLSVMHVLIAKKNP